MRTKSLAVFTADRLHRQAQKNLLPRNVIDLNEVTGKESDLRVPLMERDLTVQGVIGIGLVELIKLGCYWKPNRIETPRTRHPHISGQCPADTHLLRLPLGSQVNLNLSYDLNLRRVEA